CCEIDVHVADIHGGTTGWRWGHEGYGGRKSVNAEAHLSKANVPYLVAGIDHKMIRTL
ncbi:MAG: hypothetical protein GXN98_02390, partial [Euryarchaeota archaeon]|nr:hypothetical protein [Euryarchaeota archaeon]